MTKPPAGGRRSRIVIDVARVEAEARERKQRRFGRFGRLMSVTGLVVAGLVLVLLVGGYAWWRGYERSPAYSLALLADAAQRGDNLAVESLADVDQIAQGFVPQVIEKLAGANSPVPPQARPQLTSALPQLLPRVRDYVRDAIAQDLKAMSKGHTSFFLTALAVKGAADVKEQGDKAVVTARVGERTVELTMARDGERWKVVTVKDPQLASDIATRLAASLPAQQPQQQQNPPRRRGR